MSDKYITTRELVHDGVIRCECKHTELKNINRSKGLCEECQSDATWRCPLCYKEIKLKSAFSHAYSKHKLAKTKTRKSKLFKIKLSSKNVIEDDYEIDFISDTEIINDISESDTSNNTIKNNTIKNNDIKDNDKNDIENIDFIDKIKLLMKETIKYSEENSSLKRKLSEKDEEIIKLESLYKKLKNDNEKLENERNELAKQVNNILLTKSTLENEVTDILRDLCTSHKK